MTGFLDLARVAVLIGEIIKDYIVWDLKWVTVLRNEGFFYKKMYGLFAGPKKVAVRRGSTV